MDRYQAHLLFVQFILTYIVFTISYESSTTSIRFIFTRKRGVSKFFKEQIFCSTLVFNKYFYLKNLLF